MRTLRGDVVVRNVVGEAVAVQQPVRVLAAHQATRTRLGHDAVARQLADAVHERDQQVVEEELSGAEGESEHSADRMHAICGVKSDALRGRRLDRSYVAGGRLRRVRRKDVTMVREDAGYPVMLADIVRLLETGRRTAARSVNAVMTATYWSIGRRIVEHEQHGARRAGYGEELMERLAGDLSARFGRGFGRSNLRQMRAFYLAYSAIHQTPSGGSSRAVGGRKRQTASGEFAGGASGSDAVLRFPLPWSHYVRLLSVRTELARDFYETEALRGGWTVRQLERQIDTQFYERTALSRNKVAMLTKGAIRHAEDAVTPEEELKDPLVLEFLGLKDEYSESELEEALVLHLEHFLLELGGDFAFVGRQRRLRVGDTWYRVDLIFFHRTLRCLVVIDLKLGEFTHADAGQMHLYLNYAREHWMRGGENPPVGLILCAKKNAAVAKYALDGLPNKVLAAEYRTTLPDVKLLAEEVERTRRRIEARAVSDVVTGRAGTSRRRG